MLLARDRETRVLAGVLGRARGGEGAALVVRGAAGVGKTYAMLEEGKRLRDEISLFENGVENWARSSGQLVTSGLGGMGGFLVLAGFAGVLAIAIWNPFSMTMVGLIPGAFAVCGTSLMATGSGTKRTRGGRDLHAVGAAVAAEGLALASLELQHRIDAHAPQGTLAPLPRIRNVIAVGSGKGGVGKSTTAVNLALGLVGIGQRVGVLDADIYGPSTPRLLGVSGRVHSPDGKRLRPMEAYGAKVMSMGFMVDEDAPMIWRGPMVQGRPTTRRLRGGAGSNRRASNRSWVTTLKRCRVLPSRSSAA